MKSLNKQEIYSVAAGSTSTTSGHTHEQSAYNYAVTCGYLFGATIGAGLASIMVLPLVTYAGAPGGLASVIVGASLIVGALGGGNMLSCASSLLWKHDHYYP